MCGYFLGLNPNTGIPSTVDDGSDPSFDPTNVSSQKILKLWKKGNKLLDMFWSIWREEYLSSLRERTQINHKPMKNSSQMLPSVGSVVLIKEHLLRGMWRLGKINELMEKTNLLGLQK